MKLENKNGVYYLFYSCPVALFPTMPLNSRTMLLQVGHYHFLIRKLLLDWIRIINKDRVTLFSFIECTLFVRLVVIKPNYKITIKRIINLLFICFITVSNFLIYLWIVKNYLIKIRLSMINTLLDRILYLLVTMQIDDSYSKILSNIES